MASVNNSTTQKAHPRLPPHIGYLPLIALIFWSLECFANFSVTPQQVVDFYLKQAYQPRITETNKEVYEGEYFSALGKFDWNLQSDLSYKNSKEKILPVSPNEELKQLDFSWSLTKPFSYGGDFIFSYQRTSQDLVPNLALKTSTSISGAQTLDTLSFKWEQNLWTNFLGKNDRRDIENAKLKFENASLQEQEDLESEVLEVLKKYWEAYVDKETLEASIQSRNRYEKLVQIVKQKNRLGYTRPGELDTTMAQYETSIQNVKQNSVKYLKTLDLLKQVLKVGFTDDIEFQVPELLPKIKSLPPKDIHQLRPILIKKQEMTIEQNSYLSEKLKSKPELKLSTEVKYTGLDEKPSEAFSTAAGLNNAVYIVGLKFQYYLGSDTYKGAIKQAHFKYLKADWGYKKLLDELALNIQTTEKDLDGSYLIAQSIIRGLQYREQAVVSMEKAYKQGRIDIDDLIKAYDSLFESETKKIKAIGDYHIFLNTLSSLRDELVNSQGTLINF